MKNKQKIVITIIGFLIAFLFFILYMTTFRTCTVTFTLKVGAGIQAQEVKVGEKVKKPDTPTAEGYEFIGWYLDGKLYDFNNPVKKDIVLEAKWEEK